MPTYSYSCGCGHTMDDIRKYEDRDKFPACKFPCKGLMKRIPTACNLGGMDNLGRSKSKKNGT